MSLARMLDASAVVYTQDPQTHAYTVLARASLPCRLSSTGLRASGIDTLIDQPVYRLYWADDYALPHDCRVTVEGTAYQAMHGSAQAPTIRGRVAYRSADLIRAE